MKTENIKLNNAFAPYPEYKDSGIEWIGKIPKEWDMRTAKRMFVEVKRKGDSHLPLASVTQDSGVVLRSESGLSVWNPQDDVSMYKTITPDDFVISLRSFEGGIELSCVKGLVSPAYTVLRLTNETEKGYYRWLLKSDLFIKALQLNVRGIRDGKNISFQDFSNIFLAIPPLETQKKISEYLDEKTELIDRIIERKKRLIELLREKRTAVINQAVTKGLPARHSLGEGGDPNVELVDSGIEWIGKIPKGWEVRKFKRIANIQASNVDKLTNPEDVAVRLCNYVDVYKNERISKDIQFMEATASRSQIRKVGLRKGDVLLTKDSETADDIGIPAIISDDIPNLVSGYHLYVARPNNRFSEGNFLFRYLQSKFVRSYFETSANGVTRFGLGATAVKELPVLVPQVEEQEEIGKYLNEKTALIDQITKQVEVSITVLKEFKSSMISNVVTGKVRI